ncbi:hypothetical protein JQC91_15625 [Jannaschia sp. Os4]|uniref:hypothetical protein n=1 Tax=Jannaschia sp. Os4 TaxID=2807617 RepID=UPI001939CD6E|nr:hypothetical protein [Jannaschia sp. Os4]MBM2577736.1 hypothetical protein [Jannaschia sp. Os4]
MQVILHVGMGKNGSTAIQDALARSTDALAAHGAVYAGMRPVAPGEAPTTPVGYLRSDAATWTARADHLLGLDAAKVVVSNESLSAAPDAIDPFVARLRARADLRVVIYARDPRDWLASAHVQWAVRHKTRKGPVPAFPESARRLVVAYNGPIRWRARVGAACEVASYEAAGDVVADFAARIGVPLEPRTAPVYASPGRAETVLRALFADRHAGPVLPEAFDRAVRADLRDDGPRDVAEMAARALDTRAAQAVVDESADLFDRFAEATGLEVRGGGAGTGRSVAPEAVRAEVLDHLADLALGQALRLERLEAEVAALRAARDADPRPPAPEAPRARAPRRPWWRR